MNDMSPVIIPKSDQLNSDDLIAGPMTIIITGVDIRPGTEQPVSIHFEGDNKKPWKPCKSMARVMVAAWGPDAKQYTGRSVTLYRDPTVKWAGMDVGGIRISHMSNMERDMQMALTMTKGKRAPFIVRKLTPSPAPATVPADRASGWAADYIASVNSSVDVAALDAFVAKKAAKLAELKTARPELHVRCEAAVLAVRQSFSGSGEKTCEACGTVNPPDAIDCSNCNAALPDF